MQHPFKLSLLAALLGSLWACSSQVLPSTSHAPTTSAAVKIYAKPPAKYERLALLSHVVTSTAEWQENADATPAFTDLLEKAAAMGANGILLVDDSNTYETMAGAHYKDAYYLIPVRRKPPTVIVQAIFMVHE